MNGAYQTKSEATANGSRWLWALATLTAVSMIACGDADDRGSRPPPAPKPTPAPSPTPDTPPVAPSPEPTPTPAPPPPSAGTGTGGDATSALVERGKTVYGQACIACHNIDPTQDGPLGPAIAGSPLPLVEARVLRAAYPEGYTPKRDTKAMVALPHLEPDVPAIAAYLESLGDGEG